MKKELSKESYESLFFSNVLKNVEKTNSIETKIDEKQEQNDINNKKLSQSTEDDSEDDGGSFEAAAEEETSGGNSSDSSSGDSSGEDTDMGSGDDFGSDDMSSDGDDWGDDSGDGSEDGDSSGDDGEKEGLNSLDNNKGSSLNPFTQINQKRYHVDRLNELKYSISNAIDEYSSFYADWSEVDQLRELLKIVSEEENSFVMQQNPENLIKLGLYYEQYEKIIQNISNKISRLNSNDKK